MARELPGGCAPGDTAFQPTHMSALRGDFRLAGLPPLFVPYRNGHPRPVRFWGVQVVVTAMSVYAWINPPAKAVIFSD